MKSIYMLSDAMMSAIISANTATYEKNQEFSIERLCGIFLFLNVLFFNDIFKTYLSNYYIDIITLVIVSFKSINITHSDVYIYIKDISVISIYNITQNIPFIQYSYSLFITQFLRKNDLIITDKVAITTQYASKTFLLSHTRL